MFTFKQKNFFKSFLMLMMLSLVMFIVVGCAKDEKIDLSFAKESYEVKVGETIDVKPEVAKGKDVGEVELVYSSAEEKIAKFVDGKVTGVAVGVVRVRVTVKDTSIYKEVTINVVAQESYEIVYHLNLGVNAAANPESYTALDLPIALEEPIRVGYTFGGWFTNEEFTGEAVTQITKGSTGKIELYAKWVVVTHPITYHLDGGVNDETNPAEYTIAMLPLALEPATKADYLFKGWYLDEEFKEEFVNVPAGSVDPVVVYAKFELAYDITYNVNGGALPKDTPLAFSASDLDFTLAIPTKEGFDFIGWFVNEDLTGEPVTTLTELKDVVLYAKWEVTPETYEITYHLDGGQLPEGAPTSYKDNAELVLPIPTKEGYKFLGWFNDADFTGEAVEKIEAGSNGAKQFYAKFGELMIYNITYQLNDGHYIATHEAFKEEFLRDFYDYVKPAEDLATFMHGAGNTSGFAGTWHSVHKASLYAAGLKVSDSEKPYFINQPVYNEKWLPFFDLLDVLVKETNDTQSFWGSTWTGGVRIGEYFKGTRYADEARILELNVIPRDLPLLYDNFNEGFDLVVPAKAGYVFIGWFADAGFTGEAITRIEAGEAGDKELFAKWEIVKHNVTFDVEGETNVVEVENGAVVAKPEVDPVKEGYNFVGWFLGEEAFDFETAITKAITLVAKFEEIPVVKHEVTFDVEGETNVVEVEEGQVVAKPEVDPVKEGYTFVGWFLGEEAFDFETVITEPITLVAKFEINPDVEVFNVTFDVDGETTVVEVVEGQKVNKPEDPVKEGYTFLGWFIGEVEFDFETPITEAITLVAKFEEIPVIEVFTVTFDVDGELQEVIVESGEKVAKPEDPFKEGFIFNGWLLGEEAFDFETAITANITLVAAWTELTEEVLLDAKAALEADETIVKHFPYGVVEGNKITNLPTAVEGFPTVTVTWAPADTAEFSADLVLQKQRLLYYVTNLVATLSSPGEVSVTAEFPVNIGVVATAEAYGLSPITRAGATSFDVAAYNAENGFNNHFDTGVNIPDRTFDFNGIVFKSNFTWGTVETDFYFFMKKGSIANLTASHVTAEGEGEDIVYRITSSPLVFSGSFMKTAHNTTDKPMVIKGDQLKAVLGYVQHAAYQLYIYDGDGNRVGMHAGTNGAEEYVIPAGGYLIERGYIDGSTSNTGNLTAVSLGFFGNATKIEVIKVQLHSKYA